MALTKPRQNPARPSTMQLLGKNDGRIGRTDVGREAPAMRVYNLFLMLAPEHGKPTSARPSIALGTLSLFLPANCV